MQAIGYIRVSSQEQAQEGVSLDAQRTKIEKYAALKDLELLEIVEDAGISAKNLNRPGVQRVLDMAQARKVQAVIIWKLDRIFRSTVDALETTKRFDKWGVGLHSINETLDTQSAMGRFFFTLTAALAEMERGIVSERTKTALSHKRQKGQKTGGSIPFGYDAACGQLTPNATEQEVISRMQEMRANGFSYGRIAQALNGDGILTKNGKEWEQKAVYRVLNRQ